MFYFNMNSFEYATDKFTKFYAIARNLGTRSLNIDNNSVFFFGKLKG